MDTLPDQTPPDQTQPKPPTIDDRITAIREAVRIAQDTAKPGVRGDHLAGAREHLTELIDQWATWLHTLPEGAFLIRQTALCETATSYANRADALIEQAEKTDDNAFRAECLADARREIANLDKAGAIRDRLGLFAQPAHR